MIHNFEIIGEAAKRIPEEYRRKHPNIYLEIAAHRPRYFTAPGAGWEPLLRYGQTTIQDKVLYGTGAFLLARRGAADDDLCMAHKAIPITPCCQHEHETSDSLF